MNGWNDQIVEWFPYVGFPVQPYGMVDYIENILMKMLPTHCFPVVSNFLLIRIAWSTYVIIISNRLVN